MPKILPLLLFCLLTAMGAVAQSTSPAQSPTATSVPDAQANEDAAYRKDIEKLLEVIGLKRNMKLLLDTMIDNEIEGFSKLRPEIPADIWSDAANVVKDELKVEDLLSVLVPVYQKNLTHQDILDALRFYESPAGQHFIAAQPKMMAEAMQVGRQWGEGHRGPIQEKVAKLLKEKGY